jgi:hypothetical protein
MSAVKINSQGAVAKEKGVVLIKGASVKEKGYGQGENKDFDNLWDAQGAHSALPGAG